MFGACAQLEIEGEDAVDSGAEPQRCREVESVECAQSAPQGDGCVSFRCCLRRWLPVSVGAARIAVSGTAGKRLDFGIELVRNSKRCTVERPSGPIVCVPFEP